MDKFSYRVANMLVGNAPGAAALEATYMGPEVEVLADTVVAVTGADMPMKIDGEEVEPWTSHAVKAGSVIAFDFLRAGARAYIAFAGGIDVPEMMGSRATYTLVGFGGFEGRGLQTDDEVAFLPDGDGIPGRSVPEDLRPVYPKETGAAARRRARGLPAAAGQPDRVLRDHVAGDAGRQPDRLPLPRWGAALRRPHAAPRGGQRSGERDGHRLPVGSIQVPGGVEPIALLADAVTGGGYATIATIISADLDRAGQSKTNDSTRFVEVDLDGALQARREAAERLERVREAIGAA